MRHYIKIQSKYFNDVKYKIKNFELRKDDRGYNVGDIIILDEIENGKPTGQAICREIIYILRDCPEYGLQEGYCILGLK